MAPKKDLLKQEEILQAVVIADSFNVRFGPVTQEKPRALLPLVNVPMLDYTLEFLASSGVQEVFVFCCHLADQIRTHISNSRWSENGSSMVVKPVLAEGCLSVGDALREIDAKSLIKNDFFLVSGDVIANLNLKAIMEEHKKRREKTKSSVMTMLFKKVMPAHRTRCADDNILLAVDPTTQRVYHYQKTGLDKNPKIPVEVFDENPDIIIHQDLMDCQLCVCTPAVPPLFTDNFDYSSLDDFVRGILINEEILGNTIHISVVREEYCARVTNPYMYDAVSRDVIQRWVCPLTAESMIGDRKDPISVRRHNIYLSKDVMLARGCILEENIVISSGSSVQNGTRISNCVIGKNCKIGANVTLDSCYLWDGVVIEDSCVINGAIVCNNVTVYSNTHIQARTILSTNVKVGPDVVLPADIRLQAHPSVDEFDNDDKRQEVPETTPEYGVKSRAFRFQAEVESDDEGEQVGCEWGEALVPRDEESEDDADSLADSDMDENSLPSESPEHDDLGSKRSFLLFPVALLFVFFASAVLFINCELLCKLFEVYVAGIQIWIKQYTGYVHVGASLLSEIIRNLLNHLNFIFDPLKLWVQLVMEFVTCTCELIKLLIKPISLWAVSLLPINSMWSWVFSLVGLAFDLLKLWMEMWWSWGQSVVSFLYRIAFLLQDSLETWLGLVLEFVFGFISWV